MTDFELTSNSGALSTTLGYQVVELAAKATVTPAQAADVNDE
jgi:hypothetical protein